MTAVVQIIQSLKLSAEEIAEITEYAQPARQLAELLRRGFHRAFIDRKGKVSLERAHYLAVCQGATERPRPQVKRPTINKR